jgi:hypothetical protein
VRDNASYYCLGQRIAECSGLKAFGDFVDTRIMLRGIKLTSNNGFSCLHFKDQPDIITA